MVLYLSVDEVVEAIRSLRESRQRVAFLYQLLAVVTLFLLISLAATGGIVFAVVHLTKDTQLSSQSTPLSSSGTVSPMLTKSGTSVLVMSSQAIYTADSPAGQPDSYFDSLYSVTLSGAGATSNTLRVSGWARTTNTVYLYTTSSLTPLLMVYSNGLIAPVDASNVTAALRDINSLGSAVGARELGGRFLPASLKIRRL